MRLPIYFLPSSNSSRRQYQAAEAVGIDVLAAIKVGAFVSALRLRPFRPPSPSRSSSLLFVFSTSFYSGFLQGCATYTY